MSHTPNPSSAPPPLTAEEALFFQRVAVKRRANPHLTIEEAMRAVVDDDKRIWETIVTLPARAQAELYEALAHEIYTTIKTRHPLTHQQTHT